jgi:hypothetical protein
MNQCCDYTCPNRNSLSGYCKLTACNKPITTVYAVLPEVKTYSDYVKEALIFPHTIGDITYYSKEELIKWVEDQQKFNKDHNYGVGNWC